jgi:hypothetical protein
MSLSNEKTFAPGEKKPRGTRVRHGFFDREFA